MKKFKAIIKDSWVSDKFSIILIGMMVILSISDIIAHNILGAIIDLSFVCCSVRIIIGEYNIKN